MDLSKKGISSAAKAAAIIAAVMVVLAVVYFVPSFSTSSVGAAPASSNTRTSSSGPVTQNAGILALFGFFSQIDMQVTVLNYNQANGIIQQQSLSYLVLGKGTWNSTQYTRVEFSTPGVGNTVVAWFNAQGGIDRVDVLGQRNYTGSGAYFVASTYVNALTLVPTITSNSTLLSMLSKTAENTTSIGPTQVDLTTYSLAIPTAPYSSLSVRYATIPGTAEKVVVYFHEKTTDGTDTTIQVTSMTETPAGR